MTVKNINRLKKARENCIANAELMLWGDDCNYPSNDDINKAEKLINLATKIDDIIAERIMEKS